MPEEIIIVGQCTALEEYGCTERVPDHTSFVRCGGRILRADRCADHLQQEVTYLHGRIKSHEEVIARLKARLDELQTEKG